MQARAIFEAAVEAGKRTGKPVVPEVMVPLIATKAELDIVKARIDAMAEAVALETETRVNYQVGTMIELPRASLLRRRDRRERRVLLLRHQRSDPDHLRHQPRRRRELSRLLRVARSYPARSLRLHRPRGRRRTDAHRGRARPQDARQAQGRHLRRARRRSRLGRLLPRARARLCLMLAVPRADRAPRGGAGRARQGRRQARLDAPRSMPRVHRHESGESSI